MTKGIIIYEQPTLDGRLEYVVSYSDGRPMQTFKDYPTEADLEAAAKT